MNNINEEIVKHIWRLMVIDGRKEYIIKKIMEVYNLDEKSTGELFDIASKTCREFIAGGIQGDANTGTSSYNKIINESNTISQAINKKNKENNVRRKIFAFFLIILCIAFIRSMFSSDGSNDTFDDKLYYPEQVYNYKELHLDNLSFTKDENNDSAGSDSTSIEQLEEHPDTIKTEKMPRAENSSWENPIGNIPKVEIPSGLYRNYSIYRSDIKPQIHFERQKALDATFKGLIIVLRGLL